MEKVVYVLWRPQISTPEEFSAHLRGDVADRLLDSGVRGLQVNVADDAVASAVMRIATTQPQMEAVVSVWFYTAMDSSRHPVEKALHLAAARVDGYLVTESEPLPNTAHPPTPGQRTEGVANVAFLRRPPTMGAVQWLDIWQNHHTQVAIDTQSTFGYVQNVVVRPVTDGAGPVDGIVEELFPATAMTDLRAFFGAADDGELAQRMATMTESTARFGAAEGIDVVPTSQYVLASPFAYPRRDPRHRSSP